MNHEKLITFSRSIHKKPAQRKEYPCEESSKHSDENFDEKNKCHSSSKTHKRKKSKNQHQNNWGLDDSQVEANFGKQVDKSKENFTSVKSNVDNSSKRTTLETDIYDQAPPTPHSIEFDDSIEKAKSMSKADRERKFTSHKTRKPHLGTSSLDDVSPIPATMEYDNSERKMKATGGKLIHSRGTASVKATPIAVTLNDIEPPTPYSIKYDDSIQKAKSKTGCCTTSTYTDSTLDSEAKNPPSILEVPSAADEMSTISSSTLENLPTVTHFDRQQRNQERAQQQSNFQCNGDVEECFSQDESSSDDSSQEDMLAEAHQVYDAELIQPEQHKNSQVIVNLHTQQFEAASNKTRGRRWHENKCFVAWIILVPLIIAGGIAGVVVSLSKKDSGSNPIDIHVQPADNQVNITNALTLVMPPTYALADTYYCGYNWNAVNEDCSSATPCPSGSKSECPMSEDCIPFTNCGKNFVFLSDSTVQGGGPDIDDVKSTFYCGETVDSGNFDCDESTPCPNGPSDCTQGNEGCFAFTRCNAEVPPESFINTSFISEEFLYRTSSSTSSTTTIPNDPSTTTKTSTVSNSFDPTDLVATTTKTSSTTKAPTTTTTSTSEMDSTTSEIDTTTTNPTLADSSDTSLVRFFSLIVVIMTTKLLH